MKIVRNVAIVVVTSLTLGCSGMTPRQQSTLSGGAIGAGAGALIGGVAGGSPAAGAVIGGAAGAAGGYFLGPQHRR
ncbi:YMGG-like glycine zipper-containing protein [Geomesophilobacter sediminis]|uniref:YMGG-like Gly-zipper domain-containing protein n=1 Tax=Geomesophilobacter sediminis TaxID=2798584 RepID=A0A8J7JCP0_9BACT|nr:YMGG-like glycine zipper-containing protein [Geomesophilobacter sediminis]MBJ6724643.1 hypothetical protein [Geomesophilobacter sediminis]